MPDLLIRDIPDQLRGEIRKAAASSGRSLSDEVKHLIRKGLSIQSEKPEPGNSAWDEIRSAFGEAQLSDAEHEDFLAVTTKARQSGLRQTPEYK